MPPPPIPLQPPVPPPNFSCPPPNPVIANPLLQNNSQVLQQLATLLAQINLSNLNPVPQSNSNSAPLASSPHVSYPCAADFENRPHSLVQDGNFRTNYNIHKWNISFDGSKSGLNVDRVETNASAHNIPAYRLLNDIQYLLKGKALNWFWSYILVTGFNHRPTTWIDFRNAMIFQFKDERNDFDIRQAIGYKNLTNRFRIFIPQ